METKVTTIRAAIYARGNTSDGGGTTDAQILQLRRFAATHNLEVVGEYIDHESGSKSAGARFQRLFADAAKHRFEVVLVWALDRLTSEGVAETFRYITRLTSRGVQFVSFTEEHFRTTGRSGELMIAVSAWIAQHEAIRISERVRAGLNRARLRGTRSGKPVGRPRKMVNGETVLELRQQGKSWSEMAKACKVGATTVRRAYRSTMDTLGAPKSDASGLATT